MRTSRYWNRDWRRQPPTRADAYNTGIPRSAKLPLIFLDLIPSETSGPALGHSEIREFDANLIRNFAKEGGPIEQKSQSIVMR